MSNLLKQAIDLIDTEELVLDGLPIEIDVEHIDKIAEADNEAYALLRKNGLGASDSSIILGVNPYTTIQELIAEKKRNYLTEEEKEVGNKDAVKKGREYEPFIINKFKEFFNMPNLKPPHMYRHKDFAYLKINFDGVTFDPRADKLQYIPNEIKVITLYGMKHYNTTRAMFCSATGFAPLPINISDRNWTIEDKAAYYGIPPYYYTQLQDQMLALNAPYGYLTAMHSESKVVFTFLVYRDDATIHKLITEGFKVWEKIKSNKQNSF